VSASITLSVAGDERTVAEQTTAADLFGDDRAIVVARVNGELRDLAHALATVTSSSRCASTSRTG
jgi:threonyl-tRNA synthetase